jgi:S1-C subfamily serine protease
MEKQPGPSTPDGSTTPASSSAPPPPPPPPWPGWAQHQGPQSGGPQSGGPQSGWVGPGWQGYSPGPGWQGYPPGPGWPGYPPAPGAYGHHGRPPRKHLGLKLAATGAAAALIAGGAAAWATSSAASGALSTAQIAAKTDPGLVDVISTLGYQNGTAWGTGMVLTSNGEVLTNNHVISGATAIHIKDVGNGRTYTAKVVGYDDSDDVAVLQMQGASGLTTTKIGSSAGLTTGQAVVAIGNAEGKDGTPSVAAGKITALDSTVAAEDEGDGVVEHLSGMIQTDANVEPGDSGGPLVNSAGEVVGMDTAASSSNDIGTGTTSAVSTTAFAIPIDRALAIAGQIEAGQSSSTVHIGETAFLGVAVNSQSSGSSGFGQSTGATIEGAIQDTPAAQLGLQAGDTIESVGGHQVTSASDLQTVIEQYHPGDKVQITWTDQDGQSHSGTVTMMNGPAA